MKKNMILYFIIFYTYFALYGTIGNGWRRRHEITIDHTKIEANLTNFPILLANDNFLPDCYTNTLDNGSDIRFSSDEAGNNELSFEIVLWDKNNMEAEIWVKMPVLSSLTDTILFVWYDNSIASGYNRTDTYGSESVYISDYKGVWHLGEDPSGIAPQMRDSTQNRNDLEAVTGTTAWNASQSIQGILPGKAINMNPGGVSDQQFISKINTLLIGTSNWTISGWFKIKQIDNFFTSLWDLNSSEGNFSFEYSKDIFASYLANYYYWRDNELAAPTYYQIGNFHSYTIEIFNEWHYIVLTLENGNSETFFYDGILDGNLSYTYDRGDLASIRLGTGQRYFQGEIDEFRIINKSLSTNWIKTEFNNQSSFSIFAIGSNPVLIKKRVILTD